MAKTQHLGTYRGTTFGGDPAIVTISKKGGSYYISDGEQTKLCHPSVRDLAGAIREVGIVLHIRQLEEI